MKGFRKKRPLPDELKYSLFKASNNTDGEIAASLQTPLAAINLCAQSSLGTAFGNDSNPLYVYAQQVIGYANKGDVLIGISTSGNAKNVLAAGVAAKALGVSSIGLCGEKPCDMDEIFDTVVHVPETETYRIQELHQPVYHALCVAIEAYFFAE
jgi:D-sedoheptulose 7-phosphate isomerase